MKLPACHRKKRAATPWPISEYASLQGGVHFSSILFISAQRAAREQLHAQIAVLRAQALAIRTFTSDEVTPLISDLSDVQFLPQTIPSFSAKTCSRAFAIGSRMFAHVSLMTCGTLAPNVSRV
jgi:hypothetical protein